MANFSASNNNQVAFAPFKYTPQRFAAGSDLSTDAAAAGQVGPNYGAIKGNMTDPAKMWTTQMGNDAEAFVNTQLGKASVEGAQMKGLSDAYGSWSYKEALKDAAGGGGGKKGGGFDWGKVLSTGVSIATAFSDERSKHTIERLDDVTLMLRELNPVSFYYKEEFTNEPHRKHYGFIAQEYKETMPDATYYDEDSGMLTIDINQLIALLVRGYQQLDNRVTRIEAKNVLTGVS